MEKRNYSRLNLLVQKLDYMQEEKETNNVLKEIRNEVNKFLQ